jgi:hypothetical protein
MKMKKLIAYILFSVPVMANSQVTDDFSDGDFTKLPAWCGDTSKFEVNNAGQLHLLTTGSDTSFLSTGNSVCTGTEWNFWVKLSFNTSANNFARIYLVSDNPYLKGPLNGYYLQIGGSSDSLLLFRQEGSACEKILRGTRTFTGNSTNTLRIKVIHTNEGAWQLFTDNTGGTNFWKEGEVIDNNMNSTSWMGVYCRYTSSNSAKFYFDDFYTGPIHADTVPPVINAVNLINDHQLGILFSENVDKVDAEHTSNYYTIYNGVPCYAFCDTIAPGRVVLTFPASFIPDACDSIMAINIRDSEGNSSGHLSAPFCSYHVKAYDVVISEIMADPDPPGVLPDAEYVELFNRTDFPVPLKDWSFTSGGSSRILPDVTLPSRSFLILAKGNLLAGYGNAIDLFTSSSFLPNEGGTLILRNEEEKIIHSVTYNPAWYDNSLKAGGGWSFEMVDPDNPCGCAENWTASIDISGGTPGKINSVHHENKDTAGPSVLRAIFKDPQTVKVVFSEPMDSLSLMVNGEWLMVNENGQPDSVVLVSPEYRMLELHFSLPLQPGTTYTLLPADSITDCAGNILEQVHSVRVAVPDTVEPNDIVINEILSNPAKEGERFIELYNRSEKVLDYKDLVVATFDTLSGRLTDAVRVSEDGFLAFPGDYSVLTLDPADIKKRYFTPYPEGFITPGKMPSLGNDDGIVVIARKSDETMVDMVKYSKDMQFKLLNATDGVSLERISPLRPSQDKDNWHSAGSGCGYATPGYCNSQFMEPGESGDIVSVSPAIFTPDNDGMNDVLVLRIHPEGPGFMGSITIFDSRGRLVRQLVKNRLLSDLSEYSWDGTDENGKKAAIGIYLVYSELINPDGKVKHDKKAVVLGGKL